ncbi:Protein of unknown function [Gillisia sp. Hel1_33_143]|nr:Protein of unknown function [Gillisia sp. Hel1_33_143]
MGVSRCIQLKKGVLPGLLLIPDITGFTKYIAAADLQYSQVNIALLLEAILENNKLGLQVSEIEGDAILFYSFENDHSVDEIIDQCFSMHRAFHHQLKKIIATDCSCGACALLGELSLKFILHYGEMGSVMINDFCKLYGAEVIVAHRLLKNELSMKEYILATENFFAQYGQNSMQIFELENKSQGIEEIRTINYRYLKFD